MGGGGIGPSEAIAPSLAVLVGFDPGRDKCGVAVTMLTGEVIEHQVVAAAAALDWVRSLQGRFAVAGLVLGDRTSSKLWQAQLREGLDPAPPILLVDEHRTSLLARDRYWQMYPARGLTRLLPQGLREPPRAIDDIVAILLVERYLAAAQPLPG
ncbi:MAG: resolvase [Synechococcales cyanobacterium RM1_1_8]|nr:resolvase [Synechococcales cyanobacterium RM1_1_8]